MSDITRKEFLKKTGKVAALGSLLYLTGCGSLLTDGDEEIPPEVVDEFTGELSLLLGSHMDYVQEQSSDYEAEYGVRPSEELVTTADLIAKLQSSFIAQTSPWDAVFTIPEAVVHNAEQDWLVDLTDKIANSPVLSGTDYTLIESGLHGGMYNGRNFGVPISVGCPIMLWNKKMLEDNDLDPEAPNNWHSIQNSWDDFVEYAVKMTKVVNGVQQYGMIETFGAPSAITGYFMTLIQMHGGDVMDDDNQPVMNSDAGIESLQKMVDLLHTHKCMDPASITHAWVFDAAPAFVDGNRGFFITWPFMVGVAGNDPEAGTYQNVGFAPNPAVDTSASRDGSEYFSIPVFAENQEEAWRWIELVASPEAQRFQGANTGWAPIYEELMVDDEVVGNLITAPTILQSYQYPVKSYRTSGFARWNVILADQLHEALAERKSPKEALDDAARLIREAL